ncbi:hypothetical protein [Nitrosomonas eutropha]|uniref:Uncharacterized protein n=1 Tax=Nitrosomonas eutropha (strain DSM 101675 / C91 / Nm57) TaxID=335283 RepID=Q0AGK1_NITEC|nr:hypothetical protein [Nitrosomonas eutropha]ABI59531.1 hypothetical protein Neut_1280 [Nitrosomonas eutropha C91]
MDEEALDAALKTLANLQQEGMLIGIISCCRVADTLNNLKIAPITILIRILAVKRPLLCTPEYQSKRLSQRILQANVALRLL